MHYIAGWWYCELKSAYLWFACFTTTHTHVLKLTKADKIYGKATLRILRQVCMEEQVVMYKLTLEHSPMEFYDNSLFHCCPH